MTIALVNTTGTLTLDNVGPTIVIHAGFTFTAGNSAIFSCAAFTNGVVGAKITSVVIDGVSATRAVVQNGATANACEVWVATGLPGLTDTVTVTAASGWFIACGVEEWSGLASSPNTDSSVTGIGTSTSPSVTTAALTQASELVYAVVVPEGGFNDPITSPSSPWATLWKQVDGVNHEPGSASYQVVSSTAAVTATWSLGTSQPWITCAASFKAGTAPPPPPPASGSRMGPNVRAGSGFRMGC